MVEIKKEELLEFMRKVILTTLDYVKSQTHLQKIRNDRNKDFNNGQNSEREYNLNKINKMTEEYKTISTNQLDMMFCIRADVNKLLKQK